MLPLLRTLGLRYLGHNPGRSLLITASIALGVATLVSTQILLRCIEVAASETTTPAQGNADLYITNGEVGVQADLTEQLRAIEGVETAQPLVFQRISLSDFDSRPAVLFGIDLTTISEVGQEYGVELEWTPGTMLRRFDLPFVVISRELDDIREQVGIEKTDPVTARIAGKVVELMPVGVVDLRGPAAKLGSMVIATDIQTAARIAGHPDRISRVDVFIDSGADPVLVESEVRDVVGDQARVRTPDTQGQSTDEVIGGVRAGLSICAAGAMVVGMFLVYNALSVSVTERRRDIGIMRSLGATRFQIARLFAGEATVLGLTGAIIGIPLGTGLAMVALEMVEEELSSIFLRGDIELLLFDWQLAVLALFSGVLTALFAALVPAIHAAMDEPADAARRAPIARFGWFRRIHVLGCVLLIIGGGLVITFRDSLPPRVGSYLGLVMILVGLLMAMPLIVGWSASTLNPLFRWLFGIEERLASDNLTRAPGRTGLVVGAFGAGVALIFQIAGVGRSNEEPVMNWLDRVVKAEMFLFGGDLATATSSGSPMRPEVGKRLVEEVPGVERVVGLRYARVEYGNTMVYVLGIDSTDYVEATRKRLDEPNPELEVFGENLRGEHNAVVSDNFARKHHVEPGETITLPGPNGPIRLRVQATVQDYTWSQGTIFLDRQEYARLFEDNLVDFYHVYLEDDSAEVQAAVNRFAAREGLVTADYQTVRDYIGGLINRIYQLAYLQQVVVGVVASLGIIMAVMISVMQRRRELGLIRAIGATRLQVLRTVLAEALLMGLFGTVLGILIGLPIEWYILRIVLFEESGFVFDVLIPWQATLGIAGGGVAIACVGGGIPALQAMRVNIPDAIAYE